VIDGKELMVFKKNHDFVVVPEKHGTVPPKTAELLITNN